MPCSKELPTSSRPKLEPLIDLCSTGPGECRGRLDNSTSFPCSHTFHVVTAQRRTGSHWLASSWITMATSSAARTGEFISIVYLQQHPLLRQSVEEKKIINLINYVFSSDSEEHLHLLQHAIWQAEPDNWMSGEKCLLLLKHCTEMLWTTKAVWDSCAKTQE